MKLKFPIIIAILLIISIIVLSGCQPQTIIFKGVELKTSDLSSSTVEWINYYNSLTEEEQNSISYLPIELRNFIQEEDSSNRVELNKRVSFIGKVIRIEEENKKVLVSADKLYWCNYDNVSKLKDGYIVEVVYNSYVEEEDYLSISPESVTIVSATYDLVGVYLDAILTIWEDSTEVEKGYYNLVLDFSNLSNLSDGDKNALVYEVKSMLGVVVNQGSETDLKDDDICIKVTYKKYEEPIVEEKDTVSSTEIMIEETMLPQNPDIEINEVEVENIDVPATMEEFNEEMDSAPAVMDEGALPEISVSTNESAVKTLFLFDIVKSNKNGELCRYDNCIVKAESSEIVWVRS